MNRQEFMKKLEELLYDISPAERENAIEYYTDYFEDAGVENEAAVIRELESPQRVARTIKEGLYPNDSQEGTYTEMGYREENRASQEQMMPGTATSNGQGDSNTGAAQNVGETQKEKKSPDWSRIILIGILVVLFLPAIGAIFGVGAGILGALLGIIATIGGLIIAAFALGLAAWIGGIALIVAAFVSIFTPGNALVLAGLGLLLIAVGCLILICAVWSCGIIPAIVRGLIKLFKKLFGKRGA